VPISNTNSRTRRRLGRALYCRHEALLDVSSYWADTTVPSFLPRMKCSVCGGKRATPQARGRRPLGRQGIVPLLGGLVRLATHTQHSHSQITNSAPHVLRVVFYRVGSGKGKQMIATPIEPKASKVAQALAIAFVGFLVVISVWELFAIRF
jgi:hypothetical protein